MYPSSKIALSSTLIQQEYVHITYTSLETTRATGWKVQRTAPSISFPRQLSNQMDGSKFVSLGFTVAGKSCLKVARQLAASLRFYYGRLTNPHAHSGGG